MTQFRLLGPLEAVVNGAPAKLGGPRQRAVLAILLLRPNEPLSRDRLADELWAGAPPEDASHVLQTFVYRLRKALGPDVLASHDSGYLVRVEDDALDTRTLARLQAAGRAARDANRLQAAARAFEEALVLFRGSPLADFEYEPWAQAEIATLTEVRLACVEDKLDVEIALGRESDVVTALERLLPEHPTRERLHASLMLALYRLGRQAEALDCYQALRTRLDAELGIEPTPELKELHRRILNQDPSLSAGTPAAVDVRLPAPATSFLGRKRELAEVTALLQREDVRLLTLTGPGGTGKTRLAVQAATEVAAEYPDGVYWVPLATLRDSELVLPAVAQAIGGSDDPRSAIADRRLLLLLDNFEQVVDAAPVVAELLSACPALEVLATSRAVLDVPGEQRYPVAPLDADDGVELFMARARAINPHFESSRAVPELCARLDNLPLALELAAARTSLFPPELILERLSERLDLLEAGRGSDPRQQTLRAAIAWSYDLLDSQESALFDRFSVFVGGCTFDAAQAVAAATPTVLGSLIGKSLVRLADGRYWMLETIREFASQRLAESASGDEARAGHAGFYAGLALESEPLLRGTTMADAVQTLRVEHDNVRAAIAHDLRADPARAVAAGTALQRFWYFAGHSREGLGLLDAALAAAPELDPVARGKALRAAGTLCECHGDYARARPLLDESVAILREAGAVDQLAMALNNLGAVSLWQGDYAAATTSFEESLELKRLQGDELGSAMTLSNLAILAVKRGDYSTARQMQETAVEMLRRLGDPSSISIALQSLGEAALLEGDAELARRHLEEALQHHARMDDPFSEAEQLVLLARCDLERGDSRAARERLLDALDRCLALDHRGGLVLGLEAAADIVYAADRELALRLLGAAGALRDALGAPPWMTDRAWRDRMLERLTADGAEVDAELAAGTRLTGEEAAALARGFLCSTSDVGRAGAESAVSSGAAG